MIFRRVTKTNDNRHPWSTPFEDPRDQLGKSKVRQECVYEDVIYTDVLSRPKQSLRLA